MFRLIQLPRPLVTVYRSMVTHSVSYIVTYVKVDTVTKAFGYSIQKYGNTALVTLSLMFRLIQLTRPLVTVLRCMVTQR